MELQSNAMIARIKAREKMLSHIDPINGERLRGLKLHNTQASKRKTTWADRELENISKINNGNAMRTMMSTKHPRGWLWSDKGLRVGNKVRCVQALSSTLPTMINNTRGHTDMEEKHCRKCRSEAEDGQHFI